MDEQHLRQVIETNFQLLSMTLRQVVGRTDRLDSAFSSLQGAMTQTQGALTQTQQALKQTQQALTQTQQALTQTQHSVAEAHQAISDNRDDLTQVADRLDETVAAIKLLAFGGVEDRTRIGQLEECYSELQARVQRLEEAS